MKKLIHAFGLEGVIFVFSVVCKYRFIREEKVAKLDFKFKKKPVFRSDDNEIDNEINSEVRKEEQRSRRNLRKPRKEMDDDGSFIH